MRSENPHVIRLQDYRPPDYRIDHVDIDVHLHPTATKVRTTSTMRPSPERPAGVVPLVLDGDELTLKAILIDGKPLPPRPTRPVPTASSSRPRRRGRST